MNFLFHTTPIDWETWIPIIGVGLASYVIVGIEKWIRRKLTRSGNPLHKSNKRDGVETEPSNLEGRST